MKTVILKRGFAYTGTTVPFQRSIAAIKEMLNKHGCSKIAEIQQNGCQFSLVFEKDGAAFLVEFPITYVESERGKSKVLNMNISGRIIHDRIKAMLIDAEIGYLSFTQAMMPYLALRGADGPIALQDRIEDIGGRVDALFLPPAREMKTLT